MATLQIKRISSNTCAILCGHCRKGKVLGSDEFRQLPSSFKVKCGCGQVLQLELDRRRFTRIPVQLSGTLYTADTREFMGNLVITDMSLKGVGFGPPFPDIAVGQIYSLNFVLNNDSNTLIGKDILVRHVQFNQRAGAEFLYPEHYDFDLDFYLKTAQILD